jgi:hypothetical protein
LLLVRNLFLLATFYLFYRVDDSLESLGIVHGQVGEYLAVQTDILGTELTHELGIGDAVLACSRIDTLNPQGAEVALLVLAVAIGVGETFLVGVLCNCPNVLAGQEITAGSLENLLAACP